MPVLRSPWACPPLILSLPKDHPDPRRSIIRTPPTDSVSCHSLARMIISPGPCRPIGLPHRTNLNPNRTATAALTRTHLRSSCHCKHSFPRHCKHSFPRHCERPFPRHCERPFPRHCEHTPFPSSLRAPFPSSLRAPFPSSLRAPFPSSLLSLVIASALSLVIASTLCLVIASAARQSRWRRRRRSGNRIAVLLPSPR